MREKELHYSDVLLIPNYSTLKSRSEASIETNFLGYKFKAPFFPANMKTVIDEALAKELARRGYFYIMHRFDVDIPAFAESMAKDNLLVSITVGVNGETKDVLDKIKANGIEPQFINIDIAHGYSEHMLSMIKNVRNKFPLTNIIAGNVCTTDAVLELAKAGADCVKVGIGPGHVCTTKLMTGFSRPQFSAVLDCAQKGRLNSPNVPIIADGGIEHNGDIAKALVAGASMVCCGYLLAGFLESPSKVITGKDGIWLKEYYGSASINNKSTRTHIEGRRIEVQAKGSIWYKYQEIEESLRSSVSYAGGSDLKAFKTVDWIIQ